MLKSLVKTMAILTSFTDEHPEWGVTDIALRLGMPKSTVSCIMETLATGHFLERADRAHKYRLGPRVFELGYVARLSSQLRSEALRHMEEVQQRTGQIVYLGTLWDGSVLYLEAVYPPKKLISYSIQGRRCPAHCTGLGKAMLAYMPEAKVLKIVERKGLKVFTPTTLSTLDDLRAELARTRERGYATDKGEHHPAVWCVAVPLWNRSGELVGAMSVSGPASQFAPEKAMEYAEVLMSAASELSGLVSEKPFVTSFTFPDPLWNAKDDANEGSASRSSGSAGHALRRKPKGGPGRTAGPV